MIPTGLPPVLPKVVDVPEGVIFVMFLLPVLPVKIFPEPSIAMDAGPLPVIPSVSIDAACPGAAGWSTPKIEINSAQVITRAITEIGIRDITCDI